MDEVKSYLANTNVNAPFFLVVGDGNYANFKEHLLENGLKPVTVSSCCSAPDKPPNIDRLFRDIDFADIDSGSSDRRKVVLGLGEYLALKGEAEAFKWLSKAKDHKVGNARVVLLLRGVSSIVRKLQSDLRFDDRCVLFADDTDCDIRIAAVPSFLNLHAKNGVQELIAELESGKTNIYVKTNMLFDNALCSVRKIDSAYDAVVNICPTFRLPKNMGTHEQWKVLLDDLVANGGDISKLTQEFGDNPEAELSNWIDGVTYRHWFYFITLKLSVDRIGNSYLKHVVMMTEIHSVLRRNILTAIISMSRTDNRFDQFYIERKAILGQLIIDNKLSDSDVKNMFIDNNRRDLANGLFALTDRTLPEKKEFIYLISSLGLDMVINRATKVYTALSDYMWKYTFADPKVSPELNALFTDYYDRYKTQKLMNAIDDDFITKVEELATKRVYNELRTRADVLASIDAKEESFLCWVDALGVEYLAFVQKLCEQKGLSLRIHIAQADLPTITSVNKDFFADNIYKEREKIEELDELKHKATGGYDYEKQPLPIHLAHELDVIAKVIEKAKSKLVSDTPCKKVLIVSDHGASRLAVINGREERYETDTKGEHGGRCCKRPEDYSPTAYDLPFATESADGKFLVLANYGRFKGSRKANIEVHGGASLEEVIVPIIEITLIDGDSKIELINGDNLYASFRKPLVFTLFSKKELHNIRVVIQDQQEPLVITKVDNHHYRVATGIKRFGEYKVDIFDNDNLVGAVVLNVQSETQKKSGEDFDNLFRK